ncbi:hypothetical protein FJT64_010146 [Amphibalanus amphitrite]|uniref:Gustatory receptor n=1 Tax=Amphibalanus amphitrite TaxID=1232801 RepID=A0A6A4VND2_AMPAM|nr:hypothetical protein FJT64_010146 [Amphibalanus amphitrite]
MWPPSRLLSRLLLVGSLLTLSGLHEPQERASAVWRAARLLPLTVLLLLGVTGNLAHALSRDSVPALMYSLAVLSGVLHSLLMLLWLLRHRRRLHGLLRRAAALEEVTGGHRRPGALTALRCRVGGVVGLTVTVAVVSTASFFDSGSLHHPRYLLPLVVPAALQTPTGYWVITSLQVVTALVQVTMQVVADLLVICLTEMVALMLTGLRGQLAADVASVCSVPVLSLYASVITSLLLGGYVTLVALHSREGSARGLLVSGACLGLYVLRVLAVSCAGSRLLAERQQLLAALAAVTWRPGEPPSTEGQFLLQMLLEQARQPLGIHGGGLFVAQKSTVLSLFAFVLTYFVIMVQMKV